MPPLAVIVWLYAEPVVPAGSVGGESVITGQSMVREYARLPEQPFVSVAVTVKENAPVTVGVPVRPPPEASVRPAGSAPALSAKVYGAELPEAVIVWECAVPAVPFVSGEDGASVTVPQMTTVSLRTPVQRLESSTVISNAYLPGVVGVPLSWSVVK